MSFIQLYNLTKSYGHVQALRDVSLELAPGAIGLVGNNGAGKSTLLKVLLGLLRPDTGEGTILGLDIWNRSSQIRGLVGYMPEITATVPLLKGAEFVTLSGDLYGMPHKDARRRAHEVLNYVGLGELRYRRLDEYSTGNLQRLKLAAALVHDPQILLLDEPTNGLDPSGRSAMLHMVQDLIAETGKSVILCTHLLSDVERICEQVVVLNQGQVILSGSMRELKQQVARCYDLMWDGDGTAFVAALGRAGMSIATFSPRSANSNGSRAHESVRTTELTLELDDSAESDSADNDSADHNVSSGNGAQFAQNAGHGVRVTVDANWETRTFFQMAQEHGVTLRRLRPVEENLQDLFLRVTSYHPQEYSPRNTARNGHSATASGTAHKDGDTSP